MFFDEWCKDQGFYKKLPLDYRANFSFGQLFWTHVYYAHENLQYWRPIPDENDPTKTIATKFRIESSVPDAFRKRLPLGAPKLETNEEFIVVRAKRRPVILLLPESRLLDGLNAGLRGRVQRHLNLVAPVFSIIDRATGRAKYEAPLIDRIRRLEFPQFMFLPQEGGILETDSFLRLDELQASFTGHLEPYQYALNDESSRALKDQFRLLITGSTSKAHVQLREWLVNEPD